MEKYKIEYFGDKKDCDYGDVFVMYKEMVLLVLLVVWWYGVLVKLEYYNGNVFGLYYNGKGEFRIVEKLLKVIVEKFVGLIFVEVKVDKFVVLLLFKNRLLESVSGKKLFVDLKVVEFVSEVIDNVMGIFDDNIKVLSGDNKVIVGEGVCKEGVLLVWDVVFVWMVVVNIGKFDDKDYKKVKDVF